jgi:hypothetical protein
MPPLQFPLEILMFARLLTYEEGSLRFADFNSFLQVNRALYHIKNRVQRHHVNGGGGDGCAMVAAEAGRIRWHLLKD